MSHYHVVEACAEHRTVLIQCKCPKTHPTIRWNSCPGPKCVTYALEVNENNKIVRRPK